MSPSSLPPRKRDTRTAADRIRQDRENLKRLGVGYVGGRYASAQPLGSTAQYGDLEDDEAGDDDTEDTQAVAFRNADRATASTAGIVTLNLTYVPVDGSLHVRWNGIDQPPTEWTLNRNIVTFSDHHIRVGDVVSAAYAYNPSDGVAQPSIDWGSTGPNLVVAEGSGTDYSSPSLDDSDWAMAAGPLGNPTGPNFAFPAWPAVVDATGTTNVGVWLRRTLTLPANATISVNARVDGQWWLYVDGALLASSPTGVGAAQVGPYTQALTAGEHLIALHVNDDTADPGGDWLYADLEVTS